MAYIPEEAVTRSRILLPVDFRVQSLTSLLIVPAGYVFQPVIDARIGVLEVSGTGISAFTVSVGSAAGNYSNIASSLTPNILGITLLGTINVPMQNKVVYSPTTDTELLMRVGGIATGFTNLKGYFYMPYILFPYPGV